MSMHQAEQLLREEVTLYQVKVETSRWRPPKPEKLVTQLVNQIATPSGSDTVRSITIGMSLLAGLQDEL